MRLYNNFSQAKSEIARDLKELGVKVSTKTYQNLDTKGDENLDTYELTNYHYRITNVLTILPKDQRWCNLEFAERVDVHSENPGDAWKLREEYWTKFLNEDGRLDYTYSERMAHKINLIVRTLNMDPNSRRAILNIWYPLDINRAYQNVRIPCSLYYHFRIVNDKLNISYVMRSCDFVEHWANDLYLATALQTMVANQLRRKIGTLDHFIHSLHVYQKDVAEVF